MATETGEQLPDPATVGVVIVSAGASTRMAGLDKTLVELAGMPLIARTVDVFESCDAVGPVVLVVSRDDLNDVAEISRRRQWKKVVHVRLGGARRQLGRDDLQLELFRRNRQRGAPPARRSGTGLRRRT